MNAVSITSALALVAAVGCMASVAQCVEPVFRKIANNQIVYPTISRDGHVIVSPTIPWGMGVKMTDLSATVVLSPPANATTFIPTGISDDGSTIVGYGEYLGSTRPMRWRASSGTRLIIPVTFPPADFSVGYANAVSGDGAVVFGYEPGGKGFRWTQGAGATQIPVPPELPGAALTPIAASTSGDKAIGYVSSESFLWQSGSSAILPSPAGTHSQVVAMNEDGSVLVGYTSDEVNRFAGRWTASGHHSLGTLPNGLDPGTANAVSRDGKVIAGQGGPYGHLFVWTPQLGAIDLVQALICHGNVSIVGYQNWWVTSMTSDGKHIVGYASETGTNKNVPWIIDWPSCPADLNGDGVVDDADFSIFVMSYNIYLDTIGDLNYDCVTDDADFSHFVVAYNELLCP